MSGVENFIKYANIRWQLIVNIRRVETHSA